MSPADRIERVIRFPRPVYARLKRHAKRNGRSANAEVLIALEAHLDGKKEKER
jgi:predicted DNA-binding protein